MLILEYQCTFETFPNNLTEKIIHEDLLYFKIFMSFNNFSCVIFVLKCANTQSLKIFQGELKCANTPKLYNSDITEC